MQFAALECKIIASNNKQSLLASTFLLASFSFSWHLQQADSLTPHLLIPTKKGVIPEPGICFA